MEIEAARGMMHPYCVLSFSWQAVALFFFLPLSFLSLVETRADGRLLAACCPPRYHNTEVKTEDRRSVSLPSLPSLSLAPTFLAPSSLRGSRHLKTAAFFL